MRLGGPTHGIVTKLYTKLNQGMVGSEGSRGGWGAGSGGPRDSGGSRDGGVWRVVRVLDWG